MNCVHKYHGAPQSTRDTASDVRSRAPFKILTKSIPPVSHNKPSTTVVSLSPPVGGNPNYIPLSRAHLGNDRNVSHSPMGSNGSGRWVRRDARAARPVI